MSAGVLLITHDGLGGVLLETAVYMLGERPTRVEALAVDSNAATESLETEARTRVGRLDRGAGVMVLTDLVGATPSNIARRLAAPPRVAVVSGVNLAMLMKTLNYRQLPLERLVEKAVQGGREGIVNLGAGD